ncbi:M15 family metallopeptidase [Desulfogranum japonicum]|uniref:M15 family metallopeptidase n=1 Tax=Desulfogranum japonicum TaxID=231447 RepID=UPI000A04F413|nr:M15 family metallopeptidase [Desulfogranum japonicum]
MFYLLVFLDRKLTHLFSLFFPLLLLSCTGSLQQSTSQSASKVVPEIQAQTIKRQAPQHEELTKETIPELDSSTVKNVASGTDTKEHLLLRGQEYEIPRQWMGKRLASPVFTAADLEMIPKDLTFNGTKLFLLPEANVALQKMAEAASANGLHLKVHSSYRSEWFQRKIFLKMMKEGRPFEDIVRYVAPPGYSEHMLGTVVDFYPSNWEFAQTAAYSWLQQHAEEFGFYESYPQDQPEDMPWEAWHWRWFPSDLSN